MAHQHDNTVRSKTPRSHNTSITDAGDNNFSIKKRQTQTVDKMEELNQETTEMDDQKQKEENCKETPKRRRCREMYGLSAIGQHQ